MPVASFARVREVSSEDNIHLAENLINKTLLGKKWKTKNPGEKSAYVILEMTGSYRINGIDIGNEHSAFVEVLVGKSATVPEEFKEILITCSLMTPMESKSSSNINRVRCFNRDALVPSVAEDKWSLIKIVCTQPFNKHVSYGLSFIKVHIGEDAECSINQKNLMLEQFQNETTKVIGTIKFRENSPESEYEINSSLFNRWKRIRCNGDEHTIAPATKKHEALIPEYLSLEKDANISRYLPEKVAIIKKRSRTELEMEINKKQKSLNDSTEKLSVLKRPFNELLKDVVLVISGIQNPDRGDLRSKAIALGGKYKADWDDSCTHLICAFKNTPKYNQAKDRAKIVTRKWIEDCYSLKKYLPWRRYALDRKELSKSESDEEIFNDTLNSESYEINNLCNKTLNYSRVSNSDHLPSVSSSSESDTDDGIKRIQSIDRKNTTYKNTDIYEVSTDEEDYISVKLSK